MRQGSNQHNCGLYESVGLRAPYIPMYEHHQAATRICCAPQALLVWPNNLFKSIQRDYRKISNDALKTGTKLVVAQKTEISISADGDFSEIKKTETPSKSRRVGRYALYAGLIFLRVT